MKDVQNVVGGQNAEPFQRNVSLKDPSRRTGEAISAVAPPSVEVSMSSGNAQLDAIHTTEREAN